MNEALDPQLVDRVRASLAGVPKVREKRMFGSVGFMVRGNLCVTARPARIMCRIDPDAHAAAVKRKGVTTVIMKGREYKGYVHVDAATLSSDEALREWVDAALEYNTILEESTK